MFPGKKDWLLIKLQKRGDQINQYELEKFIIYVNSIFPNIKLTAVYSYETRSVNYLDMKIFIDDQGYIRTDFLQEGKQEE